MPVLISIFENVQCYLSNTYKILPLLLKFIGKQDFPKNFCQGYNLIQWQADF